MRSVWGVPYRWLHDKEGDLYEKYPLIFGSRVRPVFTRKITIGQRFFNAVLDLLGGLLQLHGAQFGDHGLRLLAGHLLTLLGVDRLEHFRHNFDLGFGHNRENIAVEMHRAALVFVVREHLAHGLLHALSGA